MKQTLINSILVFVVLLSMANCARVGRPTGGEKDELPPVSISAEPDFNSLNFKGNKIKIHFDEFITFKDFNKQFVISPPLKYAPEIKPMGYPAKFISIEFKDTLKPNTTYSFNFGNAIVDYAEGNPLERFTYLFSTGEYIDSLSINGSVTDAFQFEQPENISVMLYEVDTTYTDSIIYREKPLYVTNTLETNEFNLQNLKEGTYQLIALKDANNNLIFDSSIDQIAYLKDPIKLPVDTTFKLNLFYEKPAFSIENISEEAANHLLVAYKGIWDSEIVGLTDEKHNKFDFIQYHDPKADSLHIWYKNKGLDSIGIAYKQSDSIVTKILKKRKNKQDTLQVNLSVSHQLDLRDSLFIQTSTPIDSIDQSRISFQNKDSLDISFKIRKTKLPNKRFIQFDKEENQVYQLVFLPQAVRDFFGNTNKDTLHYQLKTKAIKDYGTIELKLENPNEHQIILELLDKKKEVIARRILMETSEIKYELLKPGVYMFRAIIDANNNRRWDTGNFLDKRQAEEVIYLPKELEVRANWVLSEVFVTK